MTRRDVALHLGKGPSPKAPCRIRKGKRVLSQKEGYSLSWHNNKQKFSPRHCLTVCSRFAREDAHERAYKLNNMDVEDWTQGAEEMYEKAVPAGSLTIVTKLVEDRRRSTKTPWWSQTSASSNAVK